MAIIFVGPLPQPLHGFSWINKSMLDTIKIRTSVVVFDRAYPRFNTRYISIFSRSFFSIINIFQLFILFALRRPTSFYIGLSSGFGMLIDTCYYIAAYLMCRPIFIHHHSFLYLNKPNFLSRFCFIFLKNAQHIALGARMQDALHFSYGVDLKKIMILSNAAYLTTSDSLKIFHHIQSPRKYIKVGFISNITKEKGVFDLIALAKVFANKYPSVKFLIAGPIEKTIENDFNSQISNLSNTCYVGAKYGKEKEEFYENIDILAFPTRYANEAEPVTIHEALRAGIPVIANNRGCIEELLDQSCGHVVSDPDSFVEEAITWLAPLMDSHELLVKRKVAARQQFERMHLSHSERLRHIVNCIVNGRALKAAQ